MMDGSLNDSGVELITLPYTLADHRRVFDWDTVLARVERIGRSGRGTSACGMHIHVNRKNRLLTPLTIGKLLVFMNDRRNAPLIGEIAQRSESSYARRVDKRIGHGLHPRAAQEEGEGRYEALNFTSKTVEFRIFRGNLRPDRVYKNLEFCEASIRFCHDTGIQNVSADDFCEWIKDRTSEYPTLYKFLIEKGFISPPKSAKVARPAITEEA
jgi:hypothetical protein